MSEHQWEFCELSLFGGWWKQREKGWICNLWVQYYGQDRAPSYHLAEAEGKNMKIWGYDPFAKAMGLLGVAGWELVSLESEPGASDSGKRVAVFKRPVQSGRAVDEPKLTDLLKP